MMATRDQVFKRAFLKHFIHRVGVSCLITTFIWIIMPGNLDAGQTPEKEMSDTVEALCPILAGNQGSLNDAETDVFLRCREVKILPGQTFDDLTTEQDNGLGNMTSTQTSSINTTSVEISRPAANVITARLAGLRAGGISGLALNLKNKQTRPVLLAALDSDAAGNEAVTRGIGESGKCGIFLNGL